jgi:hypothetical protein
MQIISTLGTRNDIPFVATATSGRWQWDLSKDLLFKIEPI